MRRMSITMIAALAMLAALERHVTVDPRMAQEIRDLAG